jgi:hypothetical protein
MRVNLLDVRPGFAYPDLDHYRLDTLATGLQSLRAVPDDIALARELARTSDLHQSNLLRHADHLAGRTRPFLEDLKGAPADLDVIAMRVLGAEAAFRTRTARSGVCGNYRMLYPDPERLSGLMDQWLSLSPDDAPHPLAWAMLRYLALILIHPYRDGNGRMARAVLEIDLSRITGRAIAPLTLSPFIHNDIHGLAEAVVNAHNRKTNKPLFARLTGRLEARLAYDGPAGAPA